jgi:O-antigen ligase
MPVFCGEANHHLTHFGFNSLMQPATKRMIGILANPNDNAILFILFSIRYLPKIKWKTKEMLFFFAGLIAILACQSRTGFLAFAVVFCVNYLIAQISWKQIILQVASLFLVSWLFLTFDFFNFKNLTNTEEVSHNSDYLLSLINSNAFTSTSVKGRLQVWQELSFQFLQKPIFGHAPQKNYFYENRLYAENGYLLWAWRYGILGLTAFVALFVLPVKKCIKNIRSTLEAKHFLMVIITFLITNLTNSPLSHTTLSLLFFIFAGVFYSKNS